MNMVWTPGQLARPGGSQTVVSGLTGRGPTGTEVRKGGSGLTRVGAHPTFAYIYIYPIDSDPEKAGE